MAKYREDDLQVAVIEYLKLVKPDAFYFHVPNGGMMHVSHKLKLKRMGVQPGVADLLFIRPGGRLGCIELKLPKGRQSTGQREFERVCGVYGADYKIAHSIEEVTQILREWGCL